MTQRIPTTSSITGDLLQNNSQHSIRYIIRKSNCHTGCLNERPSLLTGRFCSFICYIRNFCECYCFILPYTLECEGWYFRHHFLINFPSNSPNPVVLWFFADAVFLHPTLDSLTLWSNFPLRNDCLSVFESYFMSNVIPFLASLKKLT